MLSRIRGAPTPAKYGCLFDGTSNLSLTGKIAPFELGYIQESAKELKAAAHSAVEVRPIFVYS